MAAPYILARTFGDAHAFAQGELGLGKGHYRVVTSPASIKGPRGADLYLVPGWERRWDRFSMKGALRWTRLNVIDTIEQAEEPDRRYANDERTHEIALRYNRLREETDGLEPAGVQTAIDLPEQPEVEATPVEDEPKAEEPKRRRRRCPECGALVEPDELEQHVADHLPTGV